MDHMPENGRVIVLPESDTTLARVICREEGLTVKDQKIRIDDLLNAMLSMVEPSELTQLIMKHDDVVSDIIEPAIDNLRGNALSKALGLVVDRANSTEERSLIVDLFKVVASKFDLSALSEESFVGFLSHLLMKVEEIKSDKVFADLFLFRLSKVQLASTRNEELLRGVLKLLSQFKDAESKAFFRRNCCRVYSKGEDGKYAAIAKRNRVISRGIRWDANRRVGAGSCKA